MRYLPALLLAACGAAEHPADPHPLEVTPYAAAESNVNSYVLSDRAGTLVIDATRSSAAARDVIALARAHGGAPSTLFITHGHPDHFLGMGEMKREIPALHIVVASAAIKQDIVDFATWMDGQGWLEGEPAMKPRSAAHPDGFDYDQLEVLDGSTLALPGGETLAVDTDFPATEAAHETTLYSAELGALFTGDLAYDHVHLWLGVGVTPEAAASWQAVTRRLEAKYPATTTIYPGHGAPTDVHVLADDRAYIDDLLAIAATAPSDDAAIAAMSAKYPDYANTEFLLKMSVANQRALRAPGH